MWTWSAVLSGVVTLALAAACTALAGWLLAKVDWHRIPLPASGDLVVPVERGLASLLRTSARALHDLRYRLSGGEAAAKSYLTTLRRLLAPAVSIEGGWAPACTMFLALLLLLAAISAT